MRTEPDFFVQRSFYENNLKWNSCWSGKAAITSGGKVLPCVFAREQIAGNLYFFIWLFLHFSMTPYQDTLYNLY